MAKMIPGGAPDQSAFFLSRQAAASEALVRLYVSLLAKYNENREGEDFKREMFDKGADLQNEMLDKRLAYGGTQTPDPYGPDGARLSGGANADRRDTPPPVDTPPPPPARQPQPSNAPLGGGAQPLPAGKFSDAGTSGATDFSSRNMSPEAANAMAQAPGGDTLDRRIKPTKSTPRPINALPGPATGKKAQAAIFVPGMDPKLIDHFEQVEQKYGLPRHTLMTVLGRENDGGRFAGRHGSAEGWFQFTDALAKEYALKPGDRQDPYKMAEYAAMNMVRNNDELKRINQGKGLSNDPQDIARWGILHQFGHTNGPMFLVAQQLNPGLAATAAMKPRANPNDNAQILSNNGIASNTTVGDLVNHQAGKYVPYTNEALKLAGDRPVATRPTATTKTGVPSTVTEQNINEANTPPLMQRAPPKIKPQSAIPGGDAYASAEGGEAGSERPFGTRTQAATQTSEGSASTPPRPPANIPVIHNARILTGVNRRLVDAVRGGAELALPPGYQLHAVSGHRPEGRRSSYHYSGNATDWQIVTPDGERIPHKGPDTTGLYTRLARGIKTWVRENDPSAEREIGWGGAFETSRGSGKQDIMHVDWGGSRGRLRPDLQFGRLQPLAAHERNAPAQPRVQVAGPLPQAQPKELPKLPPGVVRTEKNLYEPSTTKANVPSEQFTPKGQFEPTYFGAQPVSTSVMDPWGRLKASPEAKVQGPKVSTQGFDEAGMVASGPPSLLGRSGESELAPEYRPPPLPRARPQTESGDLEFGTPADTLPRDNSAADSADSTLMPVPQARPGAQIDADTSLDELRQIEEARNRGGELDLTKLEQTGKDLWGDLGIEANKGRIPPASLGPDDGPQTPDTPEDTPIPLPRPKPPMGDEIVPDAAAAVASTGDIGAPSFTPAQRNYDYNSPRRLPWTAMKEDLPKVWEGATTLPNVSLPNIPIPTGAQPQLEAPAATAKELAGAMYKMPGQVNTALPNMSLEGSVTASPKNTPLPTLQQLREQVQRSAPSEDVAPPDDSDQAPGVGNQMQWLTDRFKQYQGIEAERDAAKPTLEQIGTWLKENFAPRNIPDERRPFGGEYKGVAGQAEGVARDVANMSPEERRAKLRDALFPSQENITGAMDKARTIGKAMQDWYNSPSAPKPAQPAVPPTPAKPNVVNKPPADPNKFVAPKMMPDGVTPWLANQAGAPKQGPLHHIKPPPSKKATPDLLDPNAAIQENRPKAAGKGPPPPPGSAPAASGDEPPVNYNPATGKFKAPPLPAPEAVDAIQPVEPD